MAIKKGLFQDYAKTQDLERQKRSERAKNSKYSHGRVFDQDEIGNQAVTNDAEPSEFHDTKQAESTNKNESKTLVNRTQKGTSKTSKKPLMDDKSVPKLLKREITQYSEFDINKNLLTIQGHQKLLFLGLLTKAIELQSDTLDKITIDKLIIMSNTNYQNTKLAISRLVNKGLIIRYKGKTSKAGYYSLGFNPLVFKIAKNIFTNLKYDHKLNSNNNAEVEVIN